jgi:hypothetical protein
MLEEIDRHECANLLGATQHGRIAVVAGGEPYLVVLNHLVLSGNVVFRVAADSRLAELTDGPSIDAVYEVDSVLPVGRSGWSVIVRGVLGRDLDPVDALAAQAQLRAWAGGCREVVLRLRIDELTGRRVGTV